MAPRVNSVQTKNIAIEFNTVSTLSLLKHKCHYIKRSKMNIYFIQIYYGKLYT